MAMGLRGEVHADPFLIVVPAYGCAVASVGQAVWWVRCVSGVARQGTG